MEGEYERNKTWEGGRILPMGGIQAIGQSMDTAHWMAENVTGLSRPEVV